MSYSRANKCEVLQQVLCYLKRPVFSGGVNNFRRSVAWAVDVFDLLCCRVEPTQSFLATTHFYSVIVSVVGLACEFIHIALLSRNVDVTQFDCYTGEDITVVIIQLKKVLIITYPETFFSSQSARGYKST